MTLEQNNILLFYHFIIEILYMSVCSISYLHCIFHDFIWIYIIFMKKIVLYK